MGFYNDLSIDTRSCGEADEDAMLDRRDGVAKPFTYYRCPECGRNDRPTSNLIPWMCVDCERRVTRKVKARACPFCSQPSHARACPELRAALFADPPVDIPDEPNPTPGGDPAPEWRTH